MASPEQPPRPLLFLIGDTGGGHRSAAAAVAQALEHLLPGRFMPVICDPLRGPDVPRLLRWFAGLYGPCIRLTPWLWWLFWRASESPRILGAVRRTVMAPVYGSVARAAEASRPALIVAFHPMTADPAVRARDFAGPLSPVITVITDLITAHLSWRDAAVDRVVVPSAEIAARCAQDGMEADRYVPLGLPVAAEFCQPPLGEAERRALKRELGVNGDFLVVLTGGAEGSGGLRRRAAAIIRKTDNVDVAVICGRNQSLKRRVSRLAGRAGEGRLTAHGFVGNMADWLRCADIVVGKAGPGTIAEATCCGAPLVLTSFVPGQEKGNAEFVTGVGAGVYAPRPRELAAEIGRLRRDPGALAAMRDASVRVGRPGAAADIARFLADLVDPVDPVGGVGDVGDVGDVGGAGGVDGAGVIERVGGVQRVDPVGGVGGVEPVGGIRGVGTVGGVGGDSPGADDDRALLPALVGGAIAEESALLFSLTDAADPDRRFRTAVSLKRLRRSGVLIRAALRDR
jgi:1,2-diacylglycerol 3-beta-galactosyltransferase